MISLSSSWAFLWNSLSHPVEEGQGESSWVCAWHQLSIFFLSQPFICYFLAVTKFNITKTWASGWFYPHDCGSAFLWIFHSCCLSCTGVSSCRHDGNVIKAESPGKRAGGFLWFLACWFLSPTDDFLSTSRVWEIWPVWSSNSCYFQNAFTQLFENRENCAKI